MNHERIALRARGLEKTLLRKINDLADPSCINLGLGEPSFPTPEGLRDILRKEIDRWPLGYTLNAGLPELREAIAKHSGLAVSSDQVCVTAGSEEALFASLMVLVDTGDEVLVPDPAFPTYSSIVRFAGGTPVHYPLRARNGFRPDPEDIEALAGPKTKALILNSPNNPSGAVYGSDALARLGAFLDRRGIIAVSDEVYIDISFEEPADSIARHTPRWIILNSLSKSLSMTGWRLGWCLFPSELAAPLVGLHQMAVMCAPSVSQWLALAVFRGEADRERDDFVEELRRRRNLMAGCLDGDTDLTYIPSSGALYTMVKCGGRGPHPESSLDTAIDLIHEEKVVTIPGDAFGENARGWLRLSFAADPEAITEGIRRIGRFLS